MRISSPARSPRSGSSLRSASASARRMRSTRQRLEEVVEVLVERARPATPGTGTTGTARCSSRRPARRPRSRPVRGGCRSGSAYGSPAYSRTSPAGKSMIDVEVAGAQQARCRRRRARSVGRHGQQRLPPGLQRRPAGRCCGGVPTAAACSVEPRHPVGLVAARGSRPCGRRSPSTAVVGDRVGDVDRRRRVTSIAVPGMASTPRCPAAARRLRKLRWSGKMHSSSPSMTLSRNSSGSRNAGGPALGTTARAPMRLDVAHRPGELAVDLGVDQLAHALRRLLVHHRVPDRAGVLQPVQVDRAVGAQRVEVVGAAVVLVDQRAVPSLTTSAESPPGPSVMLVSTWMATRRFGPSASSSPSSVRTTLSKPSDAELALQLAGRESRGEHRGVAVDVLGSHGSSRWSPWRWEM